MTTEFLYINHYRLYWACI